MASQPKPAAKPKPKPGKAAFNKYREHNRARTELAVYFESAELKNDQRAREKVVEKRMGEAWKDLSQDLKDE